MYGVEPHAAVRLAVVDEGVSHREASRRCGIGRRTVRKMLSHSAAPGYRRTKSVRRPKLEGFTRIIRPAPSPRGTAPTRRTTRRRPPPAGSGGGVAAPPEDQVGVDVVAASHLGHRDTRRPSLHHDPALLVLRPEPAYTTRHNKASSDSVHQPMVDTIERRTDTIRNCRFAQPRHKAGHAGHLPAAFHRLQRRNDGDPRSWCRNRTGRVRPRPHESSFARARR